MAKRGPKQKQLDARQKMAAFDLVWRRGMTKADVAEGVGVSRMMLWKWEQRADFKALVEKEYKGMVKKKSQWIRQRMRRK